MSELFDSLPLTVINDASAATVHAALEEAVKAQGKDLEFYQKRPAQAMAVFRQAARTLLLAREDAALHALWQAAPTNPGLSRTFVRALVRTEDTEELQALWQQVEKRHASDPELAELAAEVKSRRPDMRKIADYSAFGALDAPLAEVMEGLNHGRPPIQTTTRLAEMLCQKRGISGAEAKAFAEKLQWSAHLHDYFKFLTVLMKSRKSTDDPLSPEQVAQIEALNHQRVGLVVLPTHPAFERAKEAGRNIVLTHAHAGAITGWPQFVRGTELENLLFSASSEAGQKRSRHKMSTRSNGAMNFMKAVKMVKRGQHLVRIYPDGGDGGDRIPVDILGCSLDIGAGAGTLAWHGKAATFFGGARWRSDGKLELYLREGPSVDEGTDRETFEAEFAKFYAAMVEEIALGAPEDIVGKGGIWIKLARALAEQQEGN